MKIVIVGHPLKTKLREFWGKGFSPHYMMTLGADYALKAMKIRGSSINFQIWDIVTQSKCKPKGLHLLPYYYGALGGIVVFDVSNLRSFQEIPFCIQEVWANNGKGRVPIVIVGATNHVRKKGDINVSDEEARVFTHELSERHKAYIKYIRVDLRKGRNVDRTLESLGKMYLDYINSRSGNDNYKQNKN